MRLDTGQQLQISQQMKMSSRMIQSMEILQMSQQALEAKIETELASNPTLELVEATDDFGEIETELKQADRDDRDRVRELVVDGDSNGDGKADGADDFERLTNITEEYGTQWENNNFETGEPFARRMVSSQAGERDGKLDAMANAAARGASLYDQLIAQWHLADLDERTAALGEYLISMVDNDGYLRASEEELLKQAPDEVDGSPVTIDDLNDVIESMQYWLEPPGVAARDLRECLLLQIEALERNEPESDLEIIRTLVMNHLKDIEGNKLPNIVKATGYSLDEIKQGIQGLRQFTPHPGRSLASESPNHITPDAVIEFDDENDSYLATLTNGRLPSLQINRDYMDMAKDRNVEKKARDFIGGQLRNANWLIEAIEQRNRTLLRVIGVVVAAQREYFEQGPQALKPLPMTQVADQLGIHVATVSRAVSEKYLETPRGIVSLRMFFSGGTETDSGESMSWTAVQAKLKELIDNENKSKPMSDEALAKALNEQGIDIARRTIAKYRDQMSIPSARQRKEY